jgi:hypothetical protein
LLRPGGLFAGLDDWAFEEEPPVLGGLFRAGGFTFAGADRPAGLAEVF